LAAIIAVCVDTTGVVDTGKVPEVWPAGITIDVGTVAFGLVLERFTSAPPAGAVAARNTVPVEGLPDFTGLGESVRFARATSLGSAVFSVRFVLTLLLEVAVIVAVSGVPTPVVDTGKVPVV
jgi:hypothetical protein